MAHFSEGAEQILKARYLKKDKDGNLIESPDEMLKRVAEAISLAEKAEDRKKWEKKFLEIMDTLEFLPNSPTLMNAGKVNGQLAACFVLPVYDDLSSIFEMIKQTALIHKTGGGTGFNFSNLRPSGSRVNTTSGVASGPVSFMSAFDAATEVVKQGGVRRGANIGILNVTHRDIFEFINCKKDLTKFQNFNISVAMTGKFLDITRNGGRHILIDPHTKEKTVVDGKRLFDNLCQNIWDNGEPGILFLDRMNEMNPIPWLGRITAVNPCGENCLLDWESCNMGSINLSKFVVNGEINWKKLKEVVLVATRFLDNVIDVNCYPRVKIAGKTKLTRKIGLGVMGWADTLLELKLKYDSDEALQLAEKVMSTITSTSHKESEELAKERGSFPANNNKINRRNATLTTIAPTGTLSVLAGCSSGIEPIFAKKFTKKVLGTVKLNLSEKYTGLSDDYFVTALEISPEWHVRMQAAFQKYTDNAVSKTINLPFEAPLSQVKEAIYLAHSLGCKGLTMYRQGTREAPIEISTEGLSECENGKCTI